MLKDPDATLDFEVDWSQWLQASETITASGWTVPAGLTRVSDTHTGTTATVWLSGGVLGQRYTVTNEITTSGGRIDDRSLHIDVMDR